MPSDKQRPLELEKLIEKLNKAGIKKTRRQTTVKDFRRNFGADN